MLCAGKFLFFFFLRTSQARDSRVDYDRCLEVLFSAEGGEAMEAEVNRTVNRRDKQGNTPLHFATQLWGQTAVRCK